VIAAASVTVYTTE